jgi:hypothetical protein
LYATKGTAKFLDANGISATILHWPLNTSSPNALEYIRTGKIDPVINIPRNFQEEELTNDYLIRRYAADFGVPLITNIQLAQRFVQAWARKSLSDLQTKAGVRQAEVRRPSVARDQAGFSAQPLPRVEALRQTLETSNARSAQAGHRPR